MFARHFDAQSYDTAGKLGVQLQKVILFLVFSSVLSLIDLRVSTIVGVAVMVMVYAAGVHGAARRRRCALACYSVLMSIYVALTVALLIFLAVMTIYARATAHAELADDASDVMTAAGAADADAPTSMAAAMMPALPAVVHSMLARPEPIATATPTTAPEESSGSEGGEGEEESNAAPVSPWYYVLTALYFFACMVTFALKVYTIKLATEMHKHLTVAERAGNVDSGARSSCCRARACQKSEPAAKTAPAAEVVYVPACYPPGVNDEAGTPGNSSYPPNCYQPLNQAAEH